MSSSTEKITIRWLIDHVPMAFWFAAIAMVIALFGAGITFSKYEFIEEWFNNLVYLENETTFEKNQDINKQLDQKNKTLSLVNENMTVEVNELKSELEEIRGINKQLDQKNKTLSLVNENMTVEVNELKSELEENSKIKKELTQNIFELNNKIKTNEELISLLKNDNRLINDEVDTLKKELTAQTSSQKTKELEQQSANISIGDSKSNTNKSGKVQLTESDIISRYNAALKIPGSNTKTDTLSALAKKSADLKYFETAFNIALNISGFTTQNTTLSYVALEIARSGDIKNAVKVAEKIPGFSTRTDTLAKISAM